MGCVVVISGILLSRFMNVTGPSPSFVDSCKPNPPISYLCSSNSLEVEVKCTGDASQWIPAMSAQYSQFITLQTFLMINLLFWAYYRIPSSGNACLIVGIVSTLLVLAIGLVALDEK